MNTKKSVSLILALLMLSLSVSSCSEGTGDETAPEENNSTSAETVIESESESESETEDELSDGLGNPQFDGYSFRVMSCQFGGAASNFGSRGMMYTELTGNPVNDVLFESKSYIEDRFDVNYEPVDIISRYDVDTMTKTSINAGDDAFDIVINHDGMTFTLAKEGMFYHMYDVEQFDFDKPWWPDCMIDAISVCNQLYCASNYLSYLGLHWTRAIMINKDYAEEIQLEIPYDMVREGKWTTDALLSMVEGASQDLDGNGKITAKDKIAFSTGNQTFYCLQVSQDIPVYRHDENGTPYIDLDVDKISTYVDKWRGLIQSEDFISVDMFGESMFKTGNNLFCYGQIGDAYDIYRTLEMRYGFLPTPKFDEYQENYINCCTDLPWAIPKTVTEEQADIIGTLCEAISCYNYKNVLPAYYEVAMKARTADSPDDAEMLQIIADTRTISLSKSFDLQFYNILGDLGTSNKEVASYLKTTQKVADRNLSKLITAFEDMQESVPEA